MSPYDGCSDASSTSFTVGIAGDRRSSAPGIDLVGGRINCPTAELKIPSKIVRGIDTMGTPVIGANIQHTTRHTQ